MSCSRTKYTKKRDLGDELLGSLKNISIKLLPVGNNDGKRMFKLQTEFAMGSPRYLIDPIFIVWNCVCDYTYRLQG